MNQLTKIYQQLQSLFAGMTPQARVIAVLLGAAIAVSAGMLLSNATGSSTDMVYLFEGKTFDSEQLDKFEVAFSMTDLRNWQRDKQRIRVPKDKRTEYLKAISDANAVPTGLRAQVTESLREGSFLEPTKVTEARQLNAKLASIEQSIKALSFIDSVSVHYDMSREGFSSSRSKVASVGVTTKLGIPLTPEQSRNIIRFVQKAIAGLKSTDIVVMDNSTGQTFSGEEDPIALEQDRYYQIKKQRERELKERAELLLADYGDIRVEVSVEIDPTIRNEVSQLNYPGKPTAVQSSTTNKNTESQKMAQGGRPGTEPNALANRSASLSNTPEQLNKGKESSESTKLVVGSVVETMSKAGLQTKQVSFSVLVPFSYYRTAFIREWALLNPDKKENEAPPFDEASLATFKTRVETNIKNALATIVQPGTPGESKSSYVSVGDYIDPAVEKVAEPSMTYYATQWLSQSWQSLMLAGVALVAIVSMRSFAKAPTSTNDRAFENGFDIPIDDAIELNLTGLDDEGESDVFGGAMTKADPNAPIKLHTTGEDLKDELTTMVRENPDAAATLLRNWIGGAEG